MHMLCFLSEICSYRNEYKHGGFKSLSTSRFKIRLFPLVIRTLSHTNKLGGPDENGWKLVLFIVSVSKMFYFGKTTGFFTRLLCLTRHCAGEMNTTNLLENNKHLCRAFFPRRRKEHPTTST